MQTSSPRFKSLAITAGLSFWFFIITSGIGIFSIEYFVIFLGIVLAVTQIFTKKISKGLDIFAVINTKIFLGILFVFVIAIYGFLLVDLLRLKKQSQSYWMETEPPNDPRKQF